MGGSAAALVQSHLDLHWAKESDGEWPSLPYLNLEDPRLQERGVYIIWHGGPEPGIVYAGSGKIADRLKAHRVDGRVMPYMALGLGVTWAKVPFELERGVERFLVDELQPVAGGRFPNADPVEVNLPW